LRIFVHKTTNCKPQFSLEIEGRRQEAEVIPNQKMFVTDNPTRAVAHPPRLRGGLGRGVINVLDSFFKLVLRNTETKPDSYMSDKTFVGWASSLPSCT
jgi:hypothetical protein